MSNNNYYWGFGRVLYVNMHTLLSIRSKYFLYFSILGQSSISIMWTVGGESSDVHETRQHSAIFKKTTTQQDLGIV